MKVSFSVVLYFKLSSLSDLDTFHLVISTKLELVQFFLDLLVFLHSFLHAIDILTVILLAREHTILSIDALVYESIFSHRNTVLMTILFTRIHFSWHS